MNDFYQGIKPIIVDLLGLTKDAIHMHVGFLAFIIPYIFIKKLRNSWAIMLFPFGLSLSMEVLDAMTDLTRVGHFLPWANLHDLLNTNFIPVVLFILIRNGTFFHSKSR